MTGRPGCRTTEMNRRSSAPYLARTPCVPLFVHSLVGVETEGLLDYQGGRGSFPLYGGTFARSYSVSISALQGLPTKAPTKRPTKASTEVPTKVSTQVVEPRGSPVLFSSVLFLDWEVKSDPDLERLVFTSSGQPPQAMCLQVTLMSGRSCRLTICVKNIEQNGDRRKSGTKNQPKEEVFGRISLQTSGQKPRSGPPSLGKNQHFGTDVPRRRS